MKDAPKGESKYDFLDKDGNIIETVVGRPDGKGGSVTTYRDKDGNVSASKTTTIDAAGVRYIYGRQASDTRKLEQHKLDVGNPIFGGQEVMTVFEDVFVPEERVFLDGQVDFSGALVERFASYRRQSYGGCKVGVGDVLIPTF